MTEAVRAALEAEWYNGNLDEAAYHRLLAVVEAADHPHIWPKPADQRTALERLHTDPEARYWYEQGRAAALDGKADPAYARGYDAGVAAESALNDSARGQIESEPK